MRPVNVCGNVFCYDDLAFKGCARARLRPCDPGSPVKRFGYFSDRLFLLGCSLYAINRWGLKPRIHSPFLHDHFNDLLLIPCALPLLLWLHRRLNLRSHDQPPSLTEISLHLAVWSVLFEVIGPHIMPHSTGDPWDVIAYVVGGLCAGLWWHRHLLLERIAPGMRQPD